LIFRSPANYTTGTCSRMDVAGYSTTRAGVINTFWK